MDRHGCQWWCWRVSNLCVLEHANSWPCTKLWATVIKNNCLPAKQLNHSLFVLECSYLNLEPSWFSSPQGKVGLAKWQPIKNSTPPCQSFYMLDLIYQLVVSNTLSRFKEKGSHSPNNLGEISHSCKPPSSYRYEPCLPNIDIYYMIYAVLTLYSNPYANIDKFTSRDNIL